MSWQDSDSGSSSNPWAPAQDELNALLGEASRLYKEGPNQLDTGYMDKMAGYYKNIMEGGAAISPDMVQQQASEYVDPAMVQGMVDQNAAMLGQATAANSTGAAGTGNTGSSTAALAQGSSAAGASAGLNNQMLDYYNQQIDRASGDLEQERNLTMKAGEAMGDLAGQKSQADFMNQGAGWDSLNSALGVVGSIGGMGGEKITSGGGSGFKLSDETLKKDITQVGEYVVEDNEPNAGVDSKPEKKKKKKKVGKYEYEPTKEGIAKGMKPGKQTGALAQEVKEVEPDAAKRGKDGKLRVNYSALKETK
jgi:hypothetical protein